MIDDQMTEKVIKLLNELVKLDRSAVAALIANRVPCNDELAKHPTVQVARQHGGYHVGLLGILNGLCGVCDNGPCQGWGPITAVFSEAPDGSWADLSHFAKTDLIREAPNGKQNK